MFRIDLQSETWGVVYQNKVEKYFILLASITQTISDRCSLFSWNYSSPDLNMPISINRFNR